MRPDSRKGYTTLSDVAALPLVRLLLTLGLLLALAALATPRPAHALAFTSAIKDTTCAGFRAGALGCTAGEFTVNPVFSAEPGTPPFCTAGAEFNFKVDLELSGTNTDRYNVGFFVGQQGNDPRAATAGNICSAAVFPTSPAPWEDNDGNVCGDYNGGGIETTRINEIKVVCQGDTTGALAIPYVLTYNQNTGTTCTGAADVINSSPSKCNAGTASVNGVVAVSAGGYVDITKQTLPDGHAQSFSFTATGPAGSKVSALTGATLTPTTATGGTYTPATISAATNSTTFSLTDGNTARVYMDVLSTSRTLTIVESATTAWDTTASISCTNVRGTPTITTTGSTRTITVALTQANSAASCTITNTKPPTIQLTKVTTGGTGTFNFTGNNGWTSQNITTTVAGTGVAGARQTLTPSVATTLTEGAVAGYRMSNVTCSGLGAGGTMTPDYTNRTIAFDAAAMAPGSDISCTVTNPRIQSLTVNKTLTAAGSTGQQFIMNANGTTGTAAGNGATATATADVGFTATFGEAAGNAATALANYSSSYSCTNGTNGTGQSGSFTMPNASVTCTITNTRRSATLTLRTAWVTGIIGDTATTTSTGFTNNATSGASVSTGNNTTAGSAVTVYAGESGTIASTFSVGNSANYSSALACTGNATALSGNTLTIDPTDTAIVCTVTHTRRSATLTLRKTWVNGATGNTATVSSSGFTNNASSGASVSSGNNTTTGTSVTVYAAESGTISEAFSVGSVANYNATLACTGNTTALSGSTLTINPADTAIVCTFTNTRRSATLTLRKTWVNGVTGDTATVTSASFANNATSGASVSSGNNTTTGLAVTVYAGESGAISESFSVGTAANYNATLACTGNGTALAGSTLTVNPADSAIVCTFTNTRRSATLTLRKTWANAISGNIATVTSSGFANNATSGASVSTGNNTTAGSAVTVYAGESGSISESLSVGNTANYNAALACSGNGTALAGTTLTVNPADTAIVCTYTNSRRSATLTVTKTWVNAISGDTATVSTSGFTNNASSGAVVSTGNNSQTGSPRTVYAAESGTISESFSVGSAANYNATLACTGSSGLSGTTLTIDPADTAIDCTYTNTRRSATLTLRKTWSGGFAGDTATVTSSGFANNATSGASVSSGSNTTTGSAVTVYAAESGTISESFSSGSAGNYLATLACTGNGTALSGSTLTVNPADTAITCTFTNTIKQPVLALLKFSTIISDPVHGTSNPKSIPGAVRHYTLRLTNSGAGKVDSNTLVLSDPLPANLELFVGDIDGAGPGVGPVQFVDGSPASGLTFTFTALNSMTDDVDFSNDNGATWTYVPAPDANGYDPAVTHIRLRPKGAMNEAGGGNPNAEMIFRMRVK